MGSRMGECRSGVSAAERHPPAPAKITPAVVASIDAGAPYDFGEVRVAWLTLLTLTALSEWRSSGVVIARLSGHAVTLRSSPTVFADTWMSASTCRHLSGQATQSYVKRSAALGLISHQGPPVARLPTARECAPSKADCESLSR
jgi:hypothetical protein